MNVSRLPINSTILGCVQEIKEYEISVILPGPIRGKLSITNVSDIYSKSLEQYTKSPETANCPKPKSIFAPGQLLPVRVLDKVESDKQFDDSPISLVDIELSSNPKDVQGHLEISTFISNCGGMSISAAVKSVEEHGYLMDIGFPQLSGKRIIRLRLYGSPRHLEIFEFKIPLFHFRKIAPSILFLLTPQASLVSKMLSHSSLRTTLPNYLLGKWSSVM